MDPGGDLSFCQAVVELFENAGYAFEPTAPNSSHQNGPVERPHQTIADAIRTMLAGASLSPKKWPYAFYHFLHLYNVMPHGDEASPFEIKTGKKPDLRHLHIFGCCVYAFPSCLKCPDVALPNARVGVFLGFSKTMKNVLYFDVETETVKLAQYVAFDESMNDLDIKPPNTHLLDGIHSGQIDDIMEDIGMNLPNLNVSICPFHDILTISMTLDLDSPAPLAMEFDTCHQFLWAHVTKFLKLPTGKHNQKF
jgi:hypothetical protein